MARVSARAAVALAMAAVGVGAAVAGCSSAGEDPAAAPRPVSERDALAVLDRAVDLASADDLDGLCELTRARPMCERSLDDVGRDSVPDGRPRVLGTTVHDPVRTDAGTSLGGRAVEVCGVDGRGRPYRSEIMVLDQGDGPEPMNPVYWAGIDYVSAPRGRAEASVAPDAGAPGDGPGPGTAGCP